MADGPFTFPVPDDIQGSSGFFPEITLKLYEIHYVQLIICIVKSKIDNVLRKIKNPSDLVKGAIGYRPSAPGINRAPQMYIRKTSGGTP